jgi:hypothetical protein
MRGKEFLKQIKGLSSSDYCFLQRRIFSARNATKETRYPTINMTNAPVKFLRDNRVESFFEDFFNCIILSAFSRHCRTSG